MSSSKGIHRILLAEDDPLVRNFLKQVLLNEGHFVVACEDGEAAWSQLSKESFSLLITDLEMPGRSGLELAQKLRASGKQTPIIIISGNFNADALLASAAIENVQCLSKPFTIAQLSETIFRATPAHN